MYMLEIIFSVDNSSLSLDDNLKNDFLLLHERDPFGINGSFGAPEKKGSINFSKANTKFCFSLRMITVICLLMEENILSLKQTTKLFKFPTQLCFGSMSNGFSATESRKVFLNGNVYDFSVDYSSIEISETLNIHKYLMTKNNIKVFFVILS